MSTPLDSDLAQRLDPDGVHVIEDPHLGSGISSTLIVDWGKLAAFQVKHDHPDAVVIFIGANDGYPMTAPSGQAVECCGVQWASIYANRVRQMANTYRQNGAARVYWITLPTPREAERRAIARAVNAAIEVGVQPWVDQVRVIDTVPIFTPGGVYRDAMSVNGNQTIVREADGIHLNEAGSSLLAGIVLTRIAQDFTTDRTRRVSRARCARCTSRRAAGDRRRRSRAAGASGDPSGRRQSASRRPRRSSRRCRRARSAVWTRRPRTCI